MNILSKTSIKDRSGSGAGRPPYRILLVEDNTTNQRLMRRLLEAMHCQVDVAGNGQEALLKFGSGRYELIFMDCHMPVMDGFDATTEIRRVAPSSRIPIVAVTASVVKEDHDRCRLVGMNQIITKPVDPDEIRAVISRWCPDCGGLPGVTPDSNPVAP